MKNKVFFTLFISGFIFLSSCVPQRKYLDVQSRFAEADASQKECNAKLRESDSLLSIIALKNQNLEKRLTVLLVDSVDMMFIIQKNKKSYQDLLENYEQLRKLNQTENEKLYRNLKDLEDQLTNKENELNKKELALSRQQRTTEDLNKDLDKLQSDLKNREQKVKELESVLNSKDSTVKALKNNLSNALLGYKDLGLSVDIKNGKVYVSLEEQLLFGSGSFNVDKKGKEAILKLAEAMEKQTDVTITVEGHTDDVPIKSGQIKDNWDLSVLRATTIVRILSDEGKIEPKRLIASGRGEFFPIAQGKSAEARKKNRRTEIILTPKLDELFSILGN